MNNEITDTQHGYEAPQVTDYGSLAELTAATNTGAQTDAALPAHTPIAGHLS
jgi:hypothetical protein